MMNTRDKTPEEKKFDEGRMESAKIHFFLAAMDFIGEFIDSEGDVSYRNAMDAHWRRELYLQALESTQQNLVGPDSNTEGVTSIGRYRSLNEE